MVKCVVLETLYDDDKKIIGTLCKRISSIPKDERETSETIDITLHSSNAKKNKDGLIFNCHSYIPNHSDKILNAMCEYTAKYQTTIYNNTFETEYFAYITRPADNISEIRKNAISEEKLNRQKQEHKKLSFKLKNTSIGKKISSYLKKVKNKKFTEYKAERAGIDAENQAVIAAGHFEVCPHHKAFYNDYKQKAKAVETDKKRGFEDIIFKEGTEWAILMQKEMAENNNQLTSEIISRTCSRLDLCRPKYPAAFLIQTWKHGQEFGELFTRNKDLVTKLRNQSSDKFFHAEDTNIKDSLLTTQQHKR